MRIFFIAIVLWALLTAAASAFAASRTATISTASGVVTFTLHDTKCVDPKVLAHIPAQYQPEFQRADITLQDGSKRSACWSGTASRLPLPDGYLFIIDEADMTGRIDASKFDTDGKNSF